MDKIEELSKELDEIRRLKQKLTLLEGQYNEKMSELCKELGLGEQFSMIDVIKAVKSSK